jgi:hypothetical protein
VFAESETDPNKCVLWFHLRNTMHASNFLSCIYFLKMSAQYFPVNLLNPYHLISIAKIMCLCKSFLNENLKYLKLEVHKFWRKIKRSWHLFLKICHFGFSVDYIFTFCIYTSHINPNFIKTNFKFRPFILIHQKFTWKQSHGSHFGFPISPKLYPL